MTIDSDGVFDGWAWGENIGWIHLKNLAIPYKVKTAWTPPISATEYTLTVTKAGTGSGIVTSSPVGIYCGADCNEVYNEGTAVTLTATPDAGSTFAGWSGDTSNGQVTMNAHKTCTATFNTEPPTAVSLASFKAKVNGDGSVTIVWETASEVDNAGFNVYRSKRSDGTYKKVNGKLIPAQGNGAVGASYSFEDTPGRGAFYYKLEDVDYNGVSAMHGPVKVRVRSAEGEAKRRRR